MCGISQSIVSRLRTKHCKNIITSTGLRLRALTCQDEQRIVCYITSRETESATMAARLLSRDTGIKVSKWTVKKTLQKVNFNACKKKEKTNAVKKNNKA